MILDFVSSILMILDSLIVNFDDTGVCQCILMIPDSIIVNFDDTGVCQCILMVPDTIRACWWHLSPCQCMLMTPESLSVHDDDTRLVNQCVLMIPDHQFVWQKLTSLINTNNDQAVSVAAVTNARLVLVTYHRHVSVQMLWHHISTAGLSHKKPAFTGTSGWRRWLSGQRWNIRSVWDAWPTPAPSICCVNLKIKQ